MRASDGEASKAAVPERLLVQHRVAELTNGGDWHRAEIGGAISRLADAVSTKSIRRREGACGRVVLTALG
jgi:hypothetical protein